MALHQELSGTEIHTPFAFVYATEAARTGATGLTSNDEQKFALQTSDYSVWILTNSSGPTWAQVGGKYDNASELLSAIKTVDGSGSGLDADMLDGIHASSFVTSTGSVSYASSAGNADTVDGYHASDFPLKPNSSYWRNLVSGDWDDPDPTLPSGGTWAYVCQLDDSWKVGVAAGGTVISGTLYLKALCWRIA